MQQQCFKSSEAKTHFCKYGYIIIPNAIQEDVLLSIKKLSDFFENDVRDKFLYSTMACNVEDNLKIHHQVLELLTPFLSSVLDNYKTFSSTFLIKPAKGEEMDLHQDWSFTNEQEYQAMTLWLPLHDVSEKNGSVFILPQSHLYYRNKRSDSLPTARIKRSNFNHHIVTIQLKKGDVLFFNPAVFHGSHANSSNEHRRIITMTILPQDAPFIYYNKLSERYVEALLLEPDAFLKQMKIFNENGGGIKGKRIGKIKYKHFVPTQKSVLRNANLNR